MQDENVIPLPKKDEVYRPYKTIFRIEKGAWSVEEMNVKRETDKEFGACSKLGLVSIIEYPDGATTTHLSGLAPNDWFKQWSLIAHQLSNDTTLHEWQREIAAMTFESIRSLIAPGGNCNGSFES